MPVISSIKNMLLPTLALYLILMSCSSGKEKASYEQVDFSKFSPQSNDSPSYSSRLLRIVKQIGNYPTIDGPFVGLAARQSEQYRRFLWLKDFAEDNDLIKLTKDPNVNVRVYSFLALRARRSSVCKDIFEERISDTTQFYDFAGCLQLPNYLNVYYLLSLKDMLNKKEFEKYKNKISKFFTDKEWESVKRMHFFEG